MVTRNRLPKIASPMERPSSTDETREEALRRLYRRKKILDGLIGSLEEYQSHRAGHPARVIPMRSGRPR